REILPADRLGRVHLYGGEIVVELDEVEDAATDEGGGAVAPLALGVDHVVGADALEDLAMRRGDGLRPDLRDLEIDEVRRDEHGRLDRRADCAHGDGEVLRADLAQGVDVAGIGDDRLRPAPGPLLAQRLVVADREHFATEAIELACGGGAEPAEADHDHRGIVFDPINQRWASPPDDGTAAG